MKKSKQPTVKDVIKYILKYKNGIHILIAMKAMDEEAGGNFYRSLKIALRYRTVEDTFYHYRWQLLMYKDHAQYQNH